MSAYFNPRLFPRFLDLNTQTKLLFHWLCSAGIPTHIGSLCHRYTPPFL
uniref:Uncharacterized protein n=1 Tax=Siphoviridae sp. ctuy39 TaxID=2825719 RepID=A0A8S5VEB6_9CAUD|nr:MAG TPA: hypothetical protein [Siphoviridae sp. ctuy39]